MAVLMNWLGYVRQLALVAHFSQLRTLGTEDSLVDSEHRMVTRLIVLTVTE